MPKNSSGSSVRKQVEHIKRKKLAKEKVVSLTEFRATGEEAAQKSVLVVDDEEIMRNAIRRILEEDGYEVVVAEDGMALSKALESTTFHLILLDINLPWVNGIELCQILKNHANLRDVPILMVSGNKTEDEIRRGFDAGCADYITKPFDVEFLLGKVTETLARTTAAE